MSSIFPANPEVNDEFQGYRFNGISWDIIGQEYNPTVYSGTQPIGAKAGDIWIDSSTDVPSISPEAILTTTAAASTYQPIVSGVSDTEIGYLDGVTSGIQTQINNKASTTTVFSRQTSTTSSGEASTVNINTKPWNMPWGLVGYTTRGTSVSIGSNTETSTISVTFTAVSGRNYRVNYYEPIIQSGGGAYLQYKIRSDNTSGTIHQRADAEPVAYTSLDGQILDLKIIKQFTAGSNTLIGTVLPVSATAIAYANTSISCIAFISVEDMGPA